MWVYHVAPFLCLKALFVMLFMRDLSKSCGMEVYRVKKSNHNGETPSVKCLRNHLAGERILWKMSLVSMLY